MGEINHRRKKLIKFDSARFFYRTHKRLFTSTPFLICHAQKIFPMYFLQREIPQRNNFHGTELDAWERMPALPDLLVQHVQCTSLSRRNLPQAMVSPKTNFRIEVTQLLEMGYSCSDIVCGWKSLCCISHARSALNI